MEIFYVINYIVWYILKVKSHIARWKTVFLYYKRFIFIFDSFVFALFASVLQLAKKTFPKS